MIKLYCNQRYLNQQYRKIIFPVLLDLYFLKHKELLKKYQLVSSPEEADCIVVPVDIGYFYRKNEQQVLQNMILEAKELNKIVWLYSAGDFGKSVEEEGVFVFRFGGMANKLNDRTFVLPSFIQDPYSTILKKEFQPILKTEKPRIGFVGHANGSLLKYAKEFLLYCKHQIRRIRTRAYDYQPFYPSGVFRYKYLKALENSEAIETDFVYRKRYRAGVTSEEERLKTAFEFFSNMKDNPYIFCLRGGGNFSVRFYEALAMGRIPVLIDTESPLPSLGIKWKEHCIMTSFETMVQDITILHSAISSEDFTGIQERNRKLWLSHLKRESYFLKLHSQILKKQI